MQEDPVDVRPATTEDREQVWPLVQEFATSFTPERAAFDRSFDELVTGTDTLVVVAETSDGEVVGYALVTSHLTLFANGRVAWLEELMVDVDHRRGRVATALVAAAETWAQEQGAAYLALATRRAEDFYRALGYTESATFFRRMLDRPTAG